MRLTVHGARGSIPSAPDDPSEFGARTSCVSIDSGDGLLIFDAGSGIVDFGRQLLAGGGRLIDLFFGHVHYDHIIGLPYFAPLFDPSFKIRIHVGHMPPGVRCQDVIDDFLRPPFHPVGVEVFKADVEFVTLHPGQALTRQGFEIRTHRLNHPGGAIAYHVRRGGRAIVYATDHEHIPGQPDRGLEAFIHGADILVYDTTFTDCEMQRFAGYGHSTHQEGVRLCRAAGVERLMLFHQSYTHSDAALRAIEAEARAMLPGAVSARVGMVIDLPAPDADGRP